MTQIGASESRWNPALHPSPRGSTPGWFLLHALMGLAACLVAVVCAIVAAVFFDSPYTVSFGAPGDACAGNNLYLDSRTGEQLQCADGTFIRAVTPATSPWTDTEKDEILALATKLGGNGLEYAERDQVDALADRIAEQHGHAPATGDTLWEAVAYSGVPGFLLLAFGGIGVLYAIRHDLR